MGRHKLISYLVYAPKGTLSKISECIVGRTGSLKEAKKWKRQFNGRIVKERA